MNTSGQYVVEIVDFELTHLGPREIEMLPQLAYAVDLESGNILVGKSGHAKLVRGKNKHDFEGGWIFPRQNKVTFYSGFLGNVSNTDFVAYALSDALGIRLRSTS